MMMLWKAMNILYAAEWELHNDNKNLFILDEYAES
jgi:hypothetical protein